MQSLISFSLSLFLLHTLSVYTSVLPFLSWIDVLCTGHYWKNKTPESNLITSSLASSSSSPSSSSTPLYLSFRHPLLVRYISASPPRQVAMVAIPTLSLLLVLAEWAGLVDASPHLLLRPSPRERDAGAMMNFNIAVIHAGATVQAEAAVAGPGGRVLYPGFGRVYGSLGESVVTQWGSANVIWLQVGHCLLY